MFSNRFFAFILLVLTIQPATAQVPMTGAGLGVPGVIVAYQGPGDIASGAIAFYSAGRAYNAAYATALSPLADLVDTTTGLLTCTMKVKATGFADLTSAVCPTSSPTTNVVTWCTVTVGGCSVTKLYDQTGTGNHVVQATLASMPPLTFSAQNGLPCAAGTGVSGVKLATAGNITQAVPFSMTAVAKRTADLSAAQKIMANGNGSSLGAPITTPNVLQVSNNNVVLLTAADNVFHALLSVSSSTAPLFAIDSSANISTSNNGTISMSAQEFLLDRLNNAQPLEGLLCEAGIWPSDQNANYIALLANMRSATVGWNF